MNNKKYGLDELILRWEKHARERRLEQVEKLLHRIAPEVTNMSDLAAPSVTIRVSSVITDAMKEVSREETLPDCITWLKENGYWPENALIGRLQDELTAALSIFPVFQPILPPATIRASSHLWAIPAGIGGLLGVIVLGMAGGPLGAAALVLLISWLATRPNIVSLVEAIASGKNLTWHDAVNGGSSEFLKRVLNRVAASTVFSLTRPEIVPPSAKAFIDNLESQISSYAETCSTLLFTPLWAYREGVVDTCYETPEPEDDDPVSLYEAIAVLEEKVHDSQQDQQSILDAAEEVLQRFEDEGFEWKHVPNGTLFDKVVKERFKTFGNIEFGQPVRTVRPVLLRNGRLMSHGTVRRLDYDRMED